MAFEQGDEAWMVVLGDATEGAGLHKVRVHKVTGDKVQILRDAWTDEDLLEDPYDPSNKNKRKFCAITETSGGGKNGDKPCELNADETQTAGALKQYDKKHGDGEGSGAALLYRMDPSFEINHPDGVDDMVMMEQLNDAELANNLKIKFKKDLGYVRCGPTLVALNLMANYKNEDYPDGPYAECVKEQFSQMKDQDAEKPHVWALTQHCFSQAFAPLTATHTQENQSLIITGESGAGKTFNTKQILSFLAFRGGGEAEKAKTDKMLSTTPILEGFGNSNMPRNPDSSRFGKLYKIFFNKTTQKLTGCNITPYMLEKSRVSQQQMNERNFHQFYRMLAPARAIEEHKDCKDSNTGKAKSQDEINKFIQDKMTTPEGKCLLWTTQDGKQMMGLAPEKRAMCLLGDTVEEWDEVAGVWQVKPQTFEGFTYLKGGTNMLEVDYERIYGDIPKDWVPKDGVESICPAGPRRYEDAGNLTETIVALLGFFSEEDVDTILKVTAGVLHLGNLEFDGDEDQFKGFVDTGASAKALKNCADLWGVEATSIIRACTRYDARTGKGFEESDVASRTVAIINRDTMARMVYDRLFMWIVKKSSEELFTGADKATDVFIGVLDIFGFEFYENHQLRAHKMQVVNGLDQLNINICNEMLQQQFVQVIFGLEMNAYEVQKVEFTFEGFADNKYACAFLTEEKGPLLTSFANVGRGPMCGKAADNQFKKEVFKTANVKKGGPDNKGWIDKNDTSGNKEPGAVLLNFDSLRGAKVFDGIYGGAYGNREINGKVDGSEVKRINQDFVASGGEICPAFGIRHYAAEVSYDCRGWCEKDKNDPSDQMRDCLKSSSDTLFMQPVFSEPAKADQASVTAAFCSSLKTLVQVLGSTDMNFVRCLKASNPLAKRVFQSALVLKQLKYTGMLDTLKIRTFGFPMRMGYSEFRGWAKILVPSVDIEDLQEAVPALVGNLQATFAEEVFSDLPASDQVTKADQKAVVIVQGKPVDSNANMPVVMMRDWFHRGLDKKRKVLLKAHYEMVSRVCKAAACAQPFQDMKSMSKAAAPSVQLMLAAVKEVRQSENAQSQAEKLATVEFNNANVALLASEAAERKTMASEEAYVLKMKEGKYMANINAEKQVPLDQAKAAVEKGREFIKKIDALLEEQSRVHAVPVVEDSAAPDSVATPHQQKVVRYFPLVRRRNVPKRSSATKPNYKFTYNFDIKPQVAQINSIK